MKTNVEIVSFSSLEDTHKEQVANLIAAYTNGKLGEKPQMLPVEPVDIHGKYAGFVALQGDEFAGYIGASQPERWNSIPMNEVGSLWVPKEHRHRGIAHSLAVMMHTTLTAEGHVPYAFCNPLSAPIFTKLGYAEALQADIPQTAFSLCQTCPKKPTGGGCCDKPVLYKGGIQ